MKASFRQKHAQRKLKHRILLLGTAIEEGIDEEWILRRYREEVRKLELIEPECLSTGTLLSLLLTNSSG